MSQKISCSISSSGLAYEIEIRQGLLKDGAALTHFLKPLGSRFAIVTDDRVAPLHGEPLRQLLSSSGLDVSLFTFPSGEQHKTRQTKEALEDQMFQRGLGRDTCLIALGGGVVTDLGGYLAATYCRGIPLVLIPTSLMGMVDASIGGKTGVDVPYGKNLIGAIYQPKKIWVDPELLRTLPLRELRQGVVEMIKHGLIADARYFEYLETHVEQILALDLTALERAIKDSCRIKVAVVQQDEKESGLRRLLNYGHTVGHAIESAMHYAVPHGEAVSIGLVIESRLCVKLGQLKPVSLARIESILGRYGLPLHLPEKISKQMVLDGMLLDKKALKGRPRFVVIRDIGVPLSYDSAFCTYVEQSLIQEALT